MAEIGRPSTSTATSVESEKKITGGPEPLVVEVGRPRAGSADTTETESTLERRDEKQVLQARVDPEGQGQEVVEARMEDIAVKALSTDDDVTLNPWTFRAFFIGIILSGFGAALATIFLFKPQPVGVSIIFLTLISYLMGNGMAMVLPTKGAVGRWLNPFPFNSKEHLAIIIMSSSASSVAHATDVLAAQKLYYGVRPHPMISVFLLLSSQLLGYGLVGFLRKSLVYPGKMLWPGVLPLSALVETLHRNRARMAKRWKFFWIVFGAVALYEALPQYSSLDFTNIFGGAAGNEGLGLLSIGLDWQYIGTSAFFLPLQTILNSFVGYVLCIVLFCGLYYGNVWNAKNFPFLSQQLFTSNSTSTRFEIYKQGNILNSNFELDESALAAEGLPSFAASHASHLLTNNLSITASIVHVVLFNPDVIRDALPTLARMKQWATSPGSLFRKSERPVSPAEDESLDPHYRAMLAYAEVPNWWYGVILLFSVVMAIICIYVIQSTLPWWGLLLAVVISFMFSLILGAMSGLLGFHAPISTLVQLLGAKVLGGKPVANMYFVLFGSSTQGQALYLVSHLKMGQYGKLSPRCTFTFQILGTILGALINLLVMESITDNQRDILLSIQGTNVFSGQVIQSFNSNAIAFGALADKMFSIGQQYSWVVLALPVGFLVPVPFYFAHRKWPKAGFDYVVTPAISYFLGYLSAGINSSVLMHFVLAFVVQLWVRKRYPKWFLKYNYILAAAISGGTDLLVFITTFAVQGASGRAVVFPPYWGNNYQTGNVDYCAKNPGLRHAS
ncbi:hypothetical protein RB601_009895 [Gaeumannomyces tritici]